MRRSANASHQHDVWRDPSAEASRPERPFRAVRFAAAMCFVASALSVPTSSAFALREITVTGNRSLSEAEVVRRSGLQLGRPLLATDTERSAAALRSIPLIRSATVRVAWPHRAIVAVVERSPVLALRWGGAVLVLDEDGVPFRRQAGPDGLVTLSLQRAPPWIRLGEPVPDRGVREAAAAFASLDSRARAKILSLHLDAHDDLVVHLASGVVLRAGEPAELQGRLRLAREIVRALSGRGVAVRELDLRFGDKVVVRPK